MHVQSKQIYLLVQDAVVWREIEDSIILGLTAAATRTEALEVNQQDYDGYYSTGKTCEMSLSASVAKDYRSILYLVDEVSA